MHNEYTRSSRFSEWRSSCFCLHHANKPYVWQSSCLPLAFEQAPGAACFRAGPAAGGRCVAPVLLSGVCAAQWLVQRLAPARGLAGDSRAFLVRWPRRDLGGLRVSGPITGVGVVRQDNGGSVVGGLVHYWPASVHRMRPSFLTQAKSLACLGLGASPSSGMATSDLRLPPVPPLDCIIPTYIYASRLHGWRGLDSAFLPRLTRAESRARMHPQQ